MARDYHESMIRLDHDLKIAEVWTTNPRITSVMKRVGATPLDRQIAGQWWRVPFRALSKALAFGNRSENTVRHQGVSPTPARLEALARGREVQRRKREAEAPIADVAVRP